MGWTDKKIADLEKFWNKGLTTAEIGKKLDVSKNAVVGKAHRLGLQGRPSPIKREPKDVQKKPETSSSLPSPSSSASPLPKKNDFITIADLTLEMCRWPTGDPKFADFHFCGKKTFQNKPYCLNHCAEAYTTPKSKEDKAKAIQAPAEG